MQSYRKATILYLALCSAGAFFAMHYALVHLSAIKVAVSANSIPLFTAVLLMGTSLTFFKVLGSPVLDSLPSSSLLPESGSEFRPSPRGATVRETTRTAAMF